MERYDAIIVGAGHNGLVCAAYLAQSGQRVLVLEASAAPGGLAASREFHPGFYASVAHSISHFPARIARDLKLAACGFEPSAEALPTVGLNLEGAHVSVDQGAVRGVGAGDAEAYRRYRQRMRRFADALQPFWMQTMPRIGSRGLGDLKTLLHLGFNLRRLGKRELQEFLRVASLPARDLMDETFENDNLKALLSWDGLIGANLAPRSPNSAVLALLYRMAGGDGGAHTLPAGGANGLIEALCQSASAAGAELRCASRVERILVRGGKNGQRACGVQLDGGEQLDATCIISATDPQRTFFELVGVEHLDIGFTNRIRRLRCSGYVGKLHLALQAAPVFTGLEHAGGRLIIAPDLDAIEFAFDEAKYGDCPTELVMEVLLPTLHESSLAPAGQHVLSAHVMYVPHRLKGGWTDTSRRLICDWAIDGIARYAPRLREQIIACEFLTPADLEQQYRVTGGHWHHTEFAMDQMLMMRPTYEAAQYGTPIPGLYLCGAGCHPGGDLTGMAGHNAAREILR